MKIITPNMIQLSRSCIYQADKSEIKKVCEFILLTRKEKLLLDLLIENKNELVSFGVIEKQLWPDKKVSATTRRTLIHRLREKVGADNIITVKDFGCILEVRS